jgi:hypothetical protein
MSTFFHALAQGAGWLAGGLGGLVLTVLGVSLAKKLFANPMGELTLRQQHKLFLAYWHKLEQKQRYEELEALKDILFSYEDGKQPTRKQLKPFKLVTKKSFKVDSMKLVTKHYIAPKD